MNGGKYGLIPYAGSASREPGRRSVTYWLNFRASVGIGAIKPRFALYQVTAKSSSTIVNNRPRSASCHVGLNSSVVIVCIMLRNVRHNLDLLSEAILSRNLTRGAGFEVDLDAAVLLSKHLFRAIDTGVELDTTANINSHSNRSLRATAVLSAAVAVGFFETDTMLLGLSIPPGSRLLIDTDEGTIYLDGVSVIDKHANDIWPELDRNIKDFIVAAGVTGDLRGSLLYKERYL